MVQPDLICKCSKEEEMKSHLASQKVKVLTMLLGMLIVVLVVSACGANQTTAQPTDALATEVVAVTKDK